MNIISILNASAITAIRNMMLLILFRLPFALYLDK